MKSCPSISEQSFQWHRPTARRRIWTVGSQLFIATSRQTTGTDGSQLASRELRCPCLLCLITSGAGAGGRRRAAALRKASFQIGPKCDLGEVIGSHKLVSCMQLALLCMRLDGHWRIWNACWVKRALVGRGILRRTTSRDEQRLGQSSDSIRSFVHSIAPLGSQYLLNSKPSSALSRKYQGSASPVLCNKAD